MRGVWAEQRRILDLDRARRDRVAIADIDVHRQARAGEFGDEVDTDAGLFILAPGPGRAPAFWPDHEALVIDPDREDFLTDRLQLRGHPPAPAPQTQLAAPGTTALGVQVE